MKSQKIHTIRTLLIAPCGMNCRLCVAYTREKNPCPGCRFDSRAKPVTRFTCRIKKCKNLAHDKVAYCFSCDQFPCDRLKHLDKRYCTKYGMSMIGNLMQIKKIGIRRFIRSEKEKWTCPSCKQLLCVHKPECLHCGHRWRRQDFALRQQD